MFGVNKGMASVTIILFAWMLQTIVAATLTAPIVLFTRRRVHWQVWELLAFFLPFLVWTILMFSNLSTGRKSLSNLAEPALLGFSIGIAALAHVGLVSRLRERRSAWTLIVGLCFIAAGIFFVTPPLPE